jgi:general secretion pathway protein K
MPFQKINGAILIIVLWFTVILTIMVTTLAIETRLSAKAVFYNKVELAAWSDTLTALNAAQMELLINRMPDAPGEKHKIVNQKTNKKFRFNGQVLNLAYPIPDTRIVRIYDHAGKINLQRLSKKQIRQLLEKLVDNNPAKIDALIDAWQDWIDRDDFKRANGAEKDYYETLNPAYMPRNDRLETVEELLLIKGFNEIFAGVNMNAVFTIYGNHSGVNPNLATREVLLLLPGLDEESVDAILAKRQEKEFKSSNDFNHILEPEQLIKLKSWFQFSISNFFSIAIQSSVENEKIEAKKIAALDQVIPKQRAYIVTVQPRGLNKLPLILKVDPYGVLPDIGKIKSQ